MNKIFRTFAVLAVGLTMVGGGCSGASTTMIPADAQSTPEKVVQAFYAAYQQDRDSALALVDADAQKSDKFERSWTKIKDWTFSSVEVVSVSGNYVKVKFTIVVDGDEDSGTDDVTVKEVDGKWWITEIPS